MLPLSVWLPARPALPCPARCTEYIPCWVCLWCCRTTKRCLPVSTPWSGSSSASWTEWVHHPTYQIWKCNTTAAVSCFFKADGNIFNVQCCVTIITWITHHAGIMFSGQLFGIKADSLAAIRKLKQLEISTKWRISLVIFWSFLIVIKSREQQGVDATNKSPTDAPFPPACLLNTSAH